MFSYLLWNVSGGVHESKALRLNSPQPTSTRTLEQSTTANIDLLDSSSSDEDTTEHVNQRVLAGQ